MARKSEDQKAAERGMKACCFCTSCILTVLIMIITTVCRIPPKIFLNGIYIPSLDKGANSSTDTTLTFEMNFKNQNPGLRLYYHPINITFYDYRPQQAIANFTIPPFYQNGPSVKRKKYGRIKFKGGGTTKGATINTTGFDSKAAVRDISDYGYWALRIDLVTTGKYKLLWKSPIRHFKFGAIVHIGDTGIKVNHKKGARLRSGVTKIGQSILERIVFILINLFIAYFLCSY